MNSTVKRRSSCRLCDSRRLDLAWRLTPTPIADDFVVKERLNKPQPVYPLDLVLCKSCGHLQLWDTVDASLLFENYIYLTSSSPGLINHFKRYSDWVIDRYNPPPKSLIIDIGSNDGSLLNFFRADGFHVLGIDPAKEIAENATLRGIHTLPKFFTSLVAQSIDKQYGKASVITANNVFAHSDHLSDMTDGIQTLLLDQGIFVFEVSYVGDIVDKMLFDTVYHEHLSYHAVTPLVKLMDRHNLEIIDIVRIASKGGSIRVVVQKKGGPRQISAEVNEMVRLESKSGLTKPQAYETFARKIEHIKKETRQVLGDLKRKGHVIVGYGASPTVTTLMYHFQLADFLDFLVDDNPRKQDTFSPGLHIPVLPSQAIYNRKVDTVIILAWTYAEQIINRQKAFCSKGGKFIVPLPTLKIY